MDETTELLPFDAINEFMRPDYRTKVIRQVLSSLAILPEDHRSRIDHLTKILVQIPGFRNSTKALTSKRLHPTAKAFQHSPQLVAAILSAWAHTNQELRHMVYEMLIERGWELIPEDADRSLLPGFFPQWPSDEDFDTLNALFRNKYPEKLFDSDDISLMVVWLSASLPFQHNHEEDGDTDIIEDDNGSS